jgi:hypothetical protein
VTFFALQMVPFGHSLKLNLIMKNGDNYHKNKFMNQEHGLSKSSMLCFTVDSPVTLKNTFYFFIHGNGI